MDFDHESIWKIKNMTTRVPICLLFKIPLNFGILPSQHFQYAELIYSADLFAKTRLHLHMPKLAHGIQIPQISILNFSLLVPTMKFFWAVDLLVSPHDEDPWFKISSRASLFREFENLFYPRIFTSWN